MAIPVVSAHGAAIPAIGFGTWDIRGEECARAVADAIHVGYRHIDTAAGYRNEDRVGEGTRASGVPRDQLFVTTKVGPSDLPEKAFAASTERSLKKLGLDQLDLLLIHWPSNELSVAEIIGTLNAAKRRGWTRHIGVSNFTVALLDEAWAATKEPLVTNQVEYHPYLTQPSLVAAIRAKGMALTAYSPLARQAVIRDPAVIEIAKRHGKSPAQIVLRWDVQQPGVVTIPKSATLANIRANFDIFGFELTADEMAVITALGESHKLRVASSPIVPPAWDR